MPELTDTVHVAVGYGEDEQALAWTCDPGDYDDTEGWYEADVPAEMWTRFLEGCAVADGAVKEMHAIAGLGEDGRLTAPCAEWRGHEYDARVWWELVIAQSPDEETWPRRDVQAQHFDDYPAAQEFLAALPETLQILSHRLWTVRKSDLRIERREYAARSYGCDRCGWSRDEHRVVAS